MATKPSPKKSAPKKKETPAIDMEAVRLLADEMNEIMYPEDKFDFESMDDDAVLEQVNESAKAIEPTDEFSDESKATLATLGHEIEWETDDDEPEYTDEDPDAGAEDGPGASDEVNLDDMGLAELTAYAKEQGIRVPPPFLKDAKKLRDYIVKKLAEAKTGGPEKGSGKAKTTTPKEKKEKATRGPAATSEIMKMVVDNPKITTEQITAALSKKGMTCSPSTISIQKNWTLKVLEYANAKK